MANGSVWCFRRARLSLLLAAFFGAPLVIGNGCGNPFDQNNDSGPSAPPQTPEKPYSSSTVSYPEPATTVTATATFNRYDDGPSGLASIATGLPIRHAEVHVLDSAGRQIQGGETSATGAISVRIPRTAGTYTLRINSRADNDYFRVSVLKNPYDNTYYSLDASFTLAGNESSVAISIPSASANNSSDLLGGAFNILDQIYIANEFLRTEANRTCPAGCASSFTTAPKIQIYWTKGLSPGTYFEAPRARISFFTNESIGGIYRGLYILGGIEGDVCTDTDHFDRSVILHEYGHYLEAAFGKSASPGGSHDGNSLIDPRLAWSEGWADFFQAAALGRTYYRDTSRNAECSVNMSGHTYELSFPDFSMESKNSDVPATNEGVFREMSIARNLYDVMTGAAQNTTYNMTHNTDGYSANLGFNLIWLGFRAMGNSSYKFQNAGILNELLNTYLQDAGYNSTDRSNFAAVTTNEQQVLNQSLYARKLNPQVGSQGQLCTFSFAAGQPKPSTFDSSGVEVDSPWYYSNHFYRYDYDGDPANAAIFLRYTKTSGASPYDLNLYVYREDYVLLDATTIALQSFGTHPESSGTSAYPGAEHVDFSSLAAGTYLINVKVRYVANRGDTSYFLETSTGKQLCP